MGLPTGFFVWAIVFSVGDGGRVCNWSSCEESGLVLHERDSAFRGTTLTFLQSLTAVPRKAYVRHKSTQNAISHSSSIEPTLILKIVE